VRLPLGPRLDRRTHIWVFDQGWVSVRISRRVFSISNDWHVDCKVRTCAARRTISSTEFGRPHFAESDCYHSCSTTRNRSSHPDGHIFWLRDRRSFRNDSPASNAMSIPDQQK
jgi:hypothetical protein